MSRAAPRSVRERAVEAEAKASRFLADAHEARDAGKNERANRLFESAERWLDKANDLTGRGGVASDPRRLV